MQPANDCMTEQMIESIICKIREHVGEDMAVEYYPDKPSNYRLNHAHGAFLVNYGKSNYSPNEDIYLVQNERDMTITVSIVVRKLWGKLGAVANVDWLRSILSGFIPEHCTIPMKPVRDYFEAHHAGLWYYGFDFSVQSVNVQTNCINEI